jgi:hypothetical protein
MICVPGNLARSAALFQSFWDSVAGGAPTSAAHTVADAATQHRSAIALLIDNSLVQLAAWDFCRWRQEGSPIVVGYRRNYLSLVNSFSEAKTPPKASFFSGIQID